MRYLQRYAACVLLIFLNKFSLPYIPLEEHLPGITGLLEYDKTAAAPIRELTQILLRGESTLTQGERELIATIMLGALVLVCSPRYRLSAIFGAAACFGIAVLTKET